MARHSWRRLFPNYPRLEFDDCTCPGMEYPCAQQYLTLWHLAPGAEADAKRLPGYSARPRNSGSTAAAFIRQGPISAVGIAALGGGVYLTCRLCW